MKLKEKLAEELISTLDRVAGTPYPEGQTFWSATVKNVYLAGFEKARELILNAIDECHSNHPEARPQIEYSSTNYGTLYSVSDYVAKLGEEDV